MRALTSRVLLYVILYVQKQVLLNSNCLLLHNMSDILQYAIDSAYKNICTGNLAFLIMNIEQAIVVSDILP